MEEYRSIILTDKKNYDEDNTLKVTELVIKYYRQGTNKNIFTLLFEKFKSEFISDSYLILAMACHNQDYDLLCHLVSLGCDIDECDCYGRNLANVYVRGNVSDNILEYLCKNIKNLSNAHVSGNLFSDACFNNNFPCSAMKILLKHIDFSLKFNVYIFDKGYDNVHEYINGYVNTKECTLNMLCKTFLVKYFLKLNRIDENGHSALSYAIIEGNASLVNKLIKKGARLDLEKVDELLEKCKKDKFEMYSALNKFKEIKFETVLKLKDIKIFDYYINTYSIKINLKELSKYELNEEQYDKFFNKYFEL